MATKRVVSFSLSIDVDDELVRVSNAMGWPKSEIVEKALKRIFESPEFMKAITKIEAIQKDTEVLRETKK